MGERQEVPEVGVEVGQTRRWTDPCGDVFVVKHRDESLGMLTIHYPKRQKAQGAPTPCAWAVVDVMDVLRESEVVPDRVRVVSVRTNKTFEGWMTVNWSDASMSSFSLDVWAVLEPLLRDGGLMDG